MHNVCALGIRNKNYINKEKIHLWYIGRWYVMGIMVATLGFTPERVIEPIKTESDIDELWVFYSEHEYSKKAEEKVKRFARSVGIIYRSFQLPDSFDVKAIVEFMKNKIKNRAENKEITVFNVSGGTHIMAASAVLVALIYGIPMVYVREDNNSVVSLPILKIEYRDFLTPKEHEIIKILKGCEGITITALAKKLGLNKATVSQHMRRLEDKGAVVVERDPENRRTVRIRLTIASKLLVVD